MKNILDDGYVNLIEAWGSDEGIIEAARMSTDKGFIGWGDNAHHERCPDFGEKLSNKCEFCDNAPGDERLLAYLYNNKHATPFEMAGMIIEVKAPIFVFREWHRHRTQSYNEMSARYVPLPDENYLPTVERLMMQGGTNKQAQSTGTQLTVQAADQFRDYLLKVYDESQRTYEQGLIDGVPKELARLALPVARYSKMRASANLRNWMAFLTLRLSTSAQWEIRQYANAVADIFAERFPRTFYLFNLEHGTNA